MRGQRQGREVSGGGEGKEPAFEGDYEALGPFPFKLRGKRNRWTNIYSEGNFLPICLKPRRLWHESGSHGSGVQGQGSLTLFFLLFCVSYFFLIFFKRFWK